MKSIVFLFLLFCLNSCVQSTGYSPSYILSDARHETGEEKEIDSNGGEL